MVHYFLMVKPLYEKNPKLFKVQKYSYVCVCVCVCVCMHVHACVSE